jgi:hypothetical protein
MTPKQRAHWEIQPMIEAVLCRASRRGLPKDAVTDAVIGALMIWRNEDRRAVAIAVQRYLIEEAAIDAEWELQPLVMPPWKVLIRYDPEQAQANAIECWETVQRLRELVKNPGDAGDPHLSDLE